jgi:hypothetical protein
MPPSTHGWPELPLSAWKDTCSTLHMMTQVVGKIRLALSPMTNHWWQVPLYVSTRGMSTSPMPFAGRSLSMEFDFLDHVLIVETSEGERRCISLGPRTVADFYRTLMDVLKDFGMSVSIWTIPVEVPERIPFEKDFKHNAYDPEYAFRFWQALVQTDRVLKEFRSRYTGKASPVHFFWGAFDMAATRFSGRPAPDHPGAPNVARSVMLEAYSQEVSSCGFWPGTGLGRPAFYAYAYPEPQGFREYRVSPPEAYYHMEFGEFLLHYDVVRLADDPDELLLDFLQSTYEAAANLGDWNREVLERGSRVPVHA